MQDQGSKVSDVETAEGKSLLRNKISVCEKHLKTLKTKGISFYDEFLQQQDELLESFFKFKMFELHKKKQKLERYLAQSDSYDFRSVEKDVRVLFDNLYI
jgi:4-alpha-glucanotransferase